MQKKLAKKLIIALLLVSIAAVQYFTHQEGQPLASLYMLLYILVIMYSSYIFGFRGGVISSVLAGVFYSPHLILTLEFQPAILIDLLDILLFFAVGVASGFCLEKKRLIIQGLDNEISRLRILEEYSNSIIQSIQSGVITVNKDNLVAMINEAALRILDLSEKCIGQSIYELLPYLPHDIAESPQLNVQKSVDLNLNLPGKEITLRVRFFPFSEDKGKRGTVIIFDDITELKNMQMQVNRNDKLAALGVLAAGIAHEIRNPLAIIKAVEQTIKKDIKDDPEMIKALEIMDDEIGRADNVVRSLMEFAKPGRYEKKQQSLNQIVDEVLAITGTYLAQNGISLEVRKGIIPELLLDKESLKQAFINIIFNAVQAMPQGGQLTVTTEPENNFIKIQFEDTGAGIEEGNISRIFDPFFTTKSEGTGLGLPIVNRVIEEHAGVINVSSKLGQGTRFEILIPAKGAIA